jgi:ankyrin repeat protein
LKKKKISILLNYFREVVELILEAGFDINARTARGTALHDAAICGKIEVRKELCEHQMRGQRNEYGYVSILVVQFLSAEGSCKSYLTRHSYLTELYIVFTLKMESVYKNTIFGLKMTVKTGLEKIFLKLGALY